MFALIFEKKVTEISQEKFPVAKPMQWVECDETVKVGWFYVNKQFRRGLTSDAEILALEKNQKISQIKSIRDQKNTEPITDHKASLLDYEGNKTSGKSYFLFYTNRHQANPTSDPDSIIARALDSGVMPYFTKDLQGNRITVELTSDIARSLRQSIAARNDQNYKACYAIEAAIREANTIEEVEAISEKIPN